MSEDEPHRWGRNDDSSCPQGHGHGRRHRGRCRSPHSRMQNQLNIRLSQAEKELLERRAAEAGLTVSEFVRRRALGDDL